MNHDSKNNRHYLLKSMGYYTVLAHTNTRSTIYHSFMLNSLPLVDSAFLIARL